MLQWRPGKTLDAVLRIQQAIALHPGKFDWEQCYYYVTDIDIAAEVGKDKDSLTASDIDDVLIKTGLDLHNEVYDFTLPRERAVGYFVPEKALVRIGAKIPEWNVNIPRTRYFR